MARGMNKVMLIGRVGEEPKVTALQNGTVANFSFATSDRVTSRRRQNGTV